MGSKFKSSEEAVTVLKQHDKACADCPFARASLAGWTGRMTSDEWMKAARSDCRIECNTAKGPENEHWQCAGASIFRANICKYPRNPDVLVLGSDRRLVFSKEDEFIEHHGRRRSSSEKPSEWKRLGDLPRCDLCWKIALWEHPSGGLRCNTCPRPEEA